MISLPITKMHGLGNSYIYVNRQECPILEEELPSLARFVANSHTGIGSDGLILIEPSRSATVKMRIFNKDGSEAKNCGNGLRCVAKFAYEQGFTSSPTLTIETLSGIVEASITHHSNLDAAVSINMGKPILNRSQIPMVGSPIDSVVAEPFQIRDQLLKVTAVSMGNPHAVFFISDHAPLHLQLGPLIEKDARFPEGVNVEFVRLHSSKELHCSVWERGSGATQACGTGACATVVAAVLNGYISKGSETTVHLEGGDLFITWRESGEVLMRGPAITVFTGMLHIPSNPCP